jgi:hypothetical protein
MKSHVRLRAPHQVLGPVLADEPDAGLGEYLELLVGQIFDRREDLDLGRGSAGARDLRSDPLEVGPDGLGG